MSGVNFGPYNVFTNSPTDSTGTIILTCTDVGPTDAITIDLSTGSATSYAPRQMRQGSDALNYNLFRHPSRLEIWGDGTGGSSRYGPMVPPNNTQVNLTIYGCIPVRQNVRVGTYSDTITVTINS